MIINNYHIRVFEPQFALNRIIATPFETELHHLANEVERYSVLDNEYKTGDSMIYRERDYHKYPNRLAVVFEADGVFKMQTFCDGKVDKLYDNILLQKKEIEPFFCCDKKDIMVLENHFARELPRNIERIVEYINKIITAREEYEKHRKKVDGYMFKFNELVDRKKSFPGGQNCDLLQKAENTTEKFLELIFELIDSVNRKARLETDAIYLPFSKKEKNCIIFGLYYCFLKKGINHITGLRRSNSFSAYLYEMHRFLSEHPSIVDEYCNYMEYPPFEKATIKNVLHKEGLDRERWIFAADDLL